MPLYGDHVLEWLRNERPSLARRVRFHETGTGPARLDDVRAVLFWLADPLNRYPDCLEEALEIGREAEHRSLRMVNPPAVLANYGKAMQAARFSEASIPSPPVSVIAGVDDLYECGERWGLPLIVRGDQSYGHIGTRIVRDEREIEALRPEDLPDRPVVSPLLDVRIPPAGSGKGDLWSRLYHRKRVLLVGEQCVPYSLYFGGSPVVGQDTSLYQTYHGWQKRLRPYRRPGKGVLRILGSRMGLARALELEREFAAAPVAHAEVFRRAGAALGLAFLAFDYASLPDGSIVIWEANPHPFLSSPRGTILPITRGFAATTVGVYGAFARCFEALLDGDGCATPPG